MNQFNYPKDLKDVTKRVTNDRLRILLFRFMGRYNLAKTFHLMDGYEEFPLDLDIRELKVKMKRIVPSSDEKDLSDRKNKPFEGLIDERTLQGYSILNSLVLTVISLEVLFNVYEKIQFSRLFGEKKKVKTSSHIILVPNDKRLSDSIRNNKSLKKYFDKNEELYKEHNGKETLIGRKIRSFYDRDYDDIGGIVWNLRNLFSHGELTTSGVIRNKTDRLLIKKINEYLLKFIRGKIEVLIYDLKSRY